MGNEEMTKGRAVSIVRSMSSFVDRLKSVRDLIASAAERAGRSADEITLVAVSKAHPPDAVHEAIEAGQIVFGENRVQEARLKIPLCPSRARWQFIGHLQKNKVRQALAIFEMLQSVDSLDTAREIDRVAGELGTQPRVLLEINVAGESSKFGFSPARLRQDLEALTALSRLQIEGLMASPPPVRAAEDARKYFAMVRELRDGLETEFRVGLPTLSMGMSGDFPVAIEEGSTMVRVGTALFGSRVGKTWKPEGEVE